MGMYDSHYCSPTELASNLAFGDAGAAMEEHMELFFEDAMADEARLPAQRSITGRRKLWLERRGRHGRVRIHGETAVDWNSQEFWARIEIDGETPKFIKMGIFTEVASEGGRGLKEAQVLRELARWYRETNETVHVSDFARDDRCTLSQDHLNAPAALPRFSHSGTASGVNTNVYTEEHQQISHLEIVKQLGSSGGGDGQLDAVGSERSRVCIGVAGSGVDGTELSLSSSRMIGNRSEAMLLSLGLPGEAFITKLDARKDQRKGGVKERRLLSIQARTRRVCARGVRSRRVTRNIHKRTRESRERGAPVQPMTCVEGTREWRRALPPAKAGYVVANLAGGREGEAEPERDMNALALNSPRS
ncbi:hypothetical protein EV421DRAFT_1741951 [Armillaria borealis]|uniref:Uncharacterized protein n=1 Tax=Armillaria borealis TaxID=47425 RepID=A0AA39IZZ8_9AGAR|nr:hypothetical protein EV421DRAFT_1741951 [Armillaria borealis]